MEQAVFRGRERGSDFAMMSAQELDRLLDFVARMQTETEECLAIAPQREARMQLHLLRSHLRGRTETPSSLIAASGLPRGTAHRALAAMIDRGQILQRPRTASGKTFSLHPSPALLSAWMDYARRMKALVGSAFGLRHGSDYFFGASYLSASIIPPLPVMSQKLDLNDGLRILLHADPAFLAMEKVKRQLEAHFGVPIEVRALSIDRLHREILSNADNRLSRFDIVTCDVCWMAELVERGALLPLPATDDAAGLDLMDFHPAALGTVRRAGGLYGLPVQTTPELLVYRTDLFDAAGLAPPETPQETLDCARALHDPARGRAGICWNGARGTPVGTTFMMLMADFGQPVLDLPRRADGFDDGDLAPEHYRPMLDSPAALDAAGFLLDLLAVSPETVLQMSWFERARCYADGAAAMAYCYTQIMPIFESDAESPAHGRTGYCLHPAAPGAARLAPLGGWNLCIPANIRPARADAARQAVETLTSAAMAKTYIEHGSMVSSRFSVCNDPAVAHSRPVISIVDRIARAGQLQSWPRPAVGELSELVHILGDEIHTMLLRNKRPREALRDAQARCDRLMRARGRY
mgnify:CR=1 FL=1